MKGANCQIFTPRKYAKKLLSLIGYNSNLFGKTILENSCGEGHILLEIVKKYILDCQSKRKDSEEIKKGLENDIIGFEIDSKKRDICIQKLNNLCKKFNIFNVNWNIKNEDALKYHYLKKYDYVIGNPPYISYKDLSVDIRTFLKENFYSCKKGKFDYCYAFIESSISVLKDCGKMIYIIPNSIFKNVFAKNLRNIIKPYIFKIYDNFPVRVFNNANVSPSIILIDKSKYSNIINYTDETKKSVYIINKENLQDKWIFSNDILSYNDDNNEKFSDKYIISNSVATLNNESFIIKEWEDYDDFHIKFKNFLIEKALIKDAVSPNSLSKGKKYKIIFPYNYFNGQLKRYTEEDFKQKFPNGYEYLNSKKTILENRDNEKGISWFEYGRSQALKNMYRKKLVISIMVSGQVKVFEIDENTIPYSGIYIVSKDKEASLKMATSILKSSSFLRYCYEVGITCSIRTKRITCSDVKNYIISGEI